MGKLTTPRQYLRYKFDICVNSIKGVSVNDKDVLRIAWKTPIFKGKLQPITVNLNDGQEYINNNNNNNGKNLLERKVWWNQRISFDTVLWLDVNDQNFCKLPMRFLLRRDKLDMTEALGEFKIDLGSCTNILEEATEYSMDIPFQQCEIFTANLTVAYKLLEKSNVVDVEPDLLDADTGLLDSEISKLSNEFNTLKQIVISSQNFSKADYWLEKLPDMELSLQQCLAKTESIELFVNDLLDKTKITVLDDKITDLHAQLRAEEEKLRRLTDLHNVFSLNVTAELAKLRDKVFGQENSLGNRSLSKQGFANLSMSDLRNAKPSNRATVQIGELDLVESPRQRAWLENSTQLEEMRTQMDEIKVRFVQFESEVQIQKRDTESLKWERQKDMENFYLFQKSQSRFAEELSRFQLELRECKVFPQKLSQKVEQMEVFSARLSKSVAGLKLARPSEDDWWRVERSLSVPLIGNKWKDFGKPNRKGKPGSVVTQYRIGSVPPYWFLLDHFFIQPSEGESVFGRNLIPGYFLIKYCTKLDLFNVKEDWEIFNGLFFTLSFIASKHSQSANQLLFWLTNISFVLDHLNRLVFYQFANDTTSEASTNAKRVSKRMEDFIKALYTSFIGCLSQELQTCVKLFSLATQGDDWVTPILGKLDSLNTLVYNYKLKHTFIQNLLGDIFGVIDSVLFNLISSDSSFCTPSRGIQLKYFVSALDNWACSDNPANSRVTDRLCHIREVANLLLSPKSNLMDRVFRQSLFPHLSHLQMKHLLTIFVPESKRSSDKVPTALLSSLSSQVNFNPNPNVPTPDDDQVEVSAEIGVFFEETDSRARSGTPLMGRFSPPVVEPNSDARDGFDAVRTRMHDVEEALAGESYLHWNNLFSEIEKWETKVVNMEPELDEESISPIPASPTDAPPQPLSYSASSIPVTPPQNFNPNNIYSSPQLNSGGNLYSKFRSLLPKSDAKDSIG